MTPKQKAKEWAKEHKEFVGILGVCTRTARGKGGRLGTKPTKYDFVVSNGNATRMTSEPRDKITGKRSERFNGICEVTGQVCHDYKLKWWHVRRPDYGTPIDGNPNRVYGHYYFVAHEDVALAIGAQPGMGDTYEISSTRHPEWTNRQWPTELVEL